MKRLIYIKPASDIIDVGTHDVFSASTKTKVSSMEWGSSEYRSNLWDKYESNEE